MGAAYLSSVGLWNPGSSERHVNADLTLNDLPNFPKSMISEQTMLAVVRNFSPIDPAQIQLIVAGIAEIAIEFRLHLNGRASRNEHSSFKDDRKHLLELSKAARNLKNKLNDISLLHEVF